MKTHLTLAVAAMLLPFFMWGQTSAAVNAACSTAPRILCNTDLEDQSNAFGTDLITTYTCGDANPSTGYNGNERIYRLEVNIRMRYDINLSGVADPDLDFDLFLLKDGCDTGDCVESSRARSNTPERIVRDLNPGTYFIVVDTWEGEVGTFDLSVECSRASAPVSCEPAEPLWCEELVSDNTWGATNNFTADLYGCYSGTGTFNGPDQIYAFTKVSASDDLNIYLFTETENLNIFLISRCDETGFTCAAVGQDFDGGKFISEEDLGLPAGEYYVIVDGRNSGTDGAYSLLLSCEPFVLSPATEIVCGRPLEDQNFTGGSNTRMLYGCEPGNQTPYNGPEKIYFFDLPVFTDVTIDLDKTSSFGELGLFLFEEGVSSPRCITAGTRRGGDLSITRSLARGRYYIVVDSRKEAFFDLRITGCACPIDGDLECGETITASNAGGGDDVRYVGGECFSNLRVDAQDRVYEFIAPDSGMFRFSLTNTQKHLGLFILEDCHRPETCLGSSNKQGDDVVDIVLRQGQIVFVAVDGIASLVTSTFNLGVECNVLPDRDDDGVIDDLDNCPDTPNRDQADSDGDGDGDVCDPDDDNDGVIDTQDCDRLDPMINFSVGDSCNDGNPNTINDRIRTTCRCLGDQRTDSDGDGVFDDVDNCPDMPNADQADSDGDGQGNVCDSDRDGDGISDDQDCAPDNPNLSLIIGASCDDGDPTTINDMINASCSCVGQDVDNDIQLFVGSASGSVGETVCVDITATEFTNVSSGSFSISIDEELGELVEINNINLLPGTFTGSMCTAGGSSHGFVVWSANAGALTLGAATPIVEACYEIIADDIDKAAISITDACRPTEFFDINADEIDVQTNDGSLCLETTTGMTVSGVVEDAMSIGIEEVAIRLMDEDGEIAMAMTDASGEFSVPAGSGSSFAVVPESMDDLRSDLTVADAMVFRQHFTFGRTFTNPLQYIAADVDGNGQLSVRDELLLKRMILGLYEGDTPVWRFIDANHELELPEDYSVSGDIFDYPSQAHVEQLTTSMIQNFIGVRVGDLTTLDLTASSRSLDNKLITLDEQMLQRGEEITIPLSIDEEMLVSGLTMTLRYDISQLRLQEVSHLTTSWPIKVDDSESGVIEITWLEETWRALSANEVISALTFESLTSGALSQMISFDKENHPMIADEHGKIYGLDLQFTALTSVELAVAPNPTNDVIHVEAFNNGELTHADINFYDMSGRLLLSQDHILQQGANLVSINLYAEGLREGLYIIELKSEQFLQRQQVMLLR